MGVNTVDFIGAYFLIGRVRITAQISFNEFKGAYSQVSEAKTANLVVSEINGN